MKTNPQTNPDFLAGFAAGSGIHPDKAAEIWREWSDNLPAPCKAANEAGGFDSGVILGRAMAEIGGVR